MKNLKIGLVALGLLTTTLTIAQDQESGRKQKCENKFAKLDANADDKISKDEFVAAKQAADAKRKERSENPKPVTVDKKFENLDANKDGKIEREEFDAAVEKRAANADRSRKEKANDQFDKMDSNNDGVVTKEEMLSHKEDIRAKRQNKVSNRKPMDPEKKFEKLDANADGSIDKSEFENACKKKGGRKKGNGKPVK